MHRVLALAILLLSVGIVALFIIAPAHWWFPALASQFGSIDAQFHTTFIIVGLLFFVSHLVLAYLIWRAGGNRGGARYLTGDKRLEMIFGAITALIFIGTGLLGQQVWSQLRLNQPAADALKIEVTAQQFAWNFRYPGADNRFGATQAKLIDDPDNPLGLDAADPAGKDDIVRAGKLVIPVGRPIHLLLRSRDVTHSFFVPELRFKQDAVPGLTISLQFTATRIGNYEIACAELCGLGHYKMRGVLEVRDQAGYQAWLETGK